MKSIRDLLTRRKPKPLLTSTVLIILVLLFACKQEIRHPQGRGKTIYLDAKSDWQATGLWVKKGQTVSLECHGVWAVAPENENQRWPDTGPEGHGNHPGEKVHRLGNPKKELPGTPFGALLGKVSDRVFPIGNRRKIVIQSEGELYLVVNDYPFYRHDNRGGLSITIFPQ